MPKADRSTAKPEGGVMETVKVLVQAFLIAIVIRTFLYQPFNIPSASMYPTLWVGDYIFASKLSYGYSKYSFNLAPSIAGRELFDWTPVNFSGRVFFADTPKRGDVAVFRNPANTKLDFIKRVIGLPGDRIRMTSGVLIINDVPVKKEKVDPFVGQIEFDNRSQPVGFPATADRYRETLPNGVSYMVLDTQPAGAVDTTGEYVVPPDHYFMMGDNRDNSADSRYPDGVGYVPVENFIGRADLIFFSVETGTPIYEVWKWPFIIRWSRLLNLVH